MDDLSTETILAKVHELQKEHQHFNEVANLALNIAHRLASFVSSVAELSDTEIKGNPDRLNSLREQARILIRQTVLEIGRVD